MATKAYLTLKGMEGYLEELAKAGEDVDQHAADALEAGGEVMLAGMQRRVPVLTGELRSSLIRTAAKQDGNYISVSVGLQSGVSKRTAIKAIVQEFGSVHQAAQPYLRPTWKADKARARKAMRDILASNGVLPG